MTSEDKLARDAGTATALLAGTVAILAQGSGDGWGVTQPVFVSSSTPACVPPGEPLGVSPSQSGPEAQKFASLCAISASLGLIVPNSA